MIQNVRIYMNSWEAKIVPDSVLPKIVARQVLETTGPRRQSNHVCVCLFACLLACLLVCLFVCLFLFFCLCLFVFVCLFLFVCLFVFVCLFFLFVCPCL